MASSTRSRFGRSFCFKMAVAKSSGFLEVKHSSLLQLSWYYIAQKINLLGWSSFRLFFGGIWSHDVVDFSGTWQMYNTKEIRRRLRKYWRLLLNLKSRWEESKKESVMSLSSCCGKKINGPSQRSNHTHTNWSFCRVIQPGWFRLNQFLMRFDSTYAMSTYVSLYCSWGWLIRWAESWDSGML